MRGTKARAIRKLQASCAHVVGRLTSAVFQATFAGNITKPARSARCANCDAHLTVRVRD